MVLADKYTVLWLYCVLTSQNAWNFHKRDIESKTDQKVSGYTAPNLKTNKQKKRIGLPELWQAEPEVFRMTTKC